MAVTFWALVGVATVAGLSMVWTLGANGNSPPFAPAIGANAVSTMRAAFLIGILAALGAFPGGLAAVLVGFEDRALAHARVDGRDHVEDGDFAVELSERCPRAASAWGEPSRTTRTCDGGRTWTPTAL